MSEGEGHRFSRNSPVALPLRSPSICATNFSGYPDENRISLLKKLNWLLHTKGEGQTIMFDYCRMRFYGPEYNYLRTVCLNMETMEVSFPDGKGQVWVHSLDTFLSIMKTQTPGVLQLDLRLTKAEKKMFGTPRFNLPPSTLHHFLLANDATMDGPAAQGKGPVTSITQTRPGKSISFSDSFSSVPGSAIPIAEETRLKEQKWCFQPAGDANYFSKIVHLMITRGPELYQIFLMLDRNKKGYIDVADLEAAVEEITDPDIKCQFSPLSIVRMVADADPTNIDRVRFSDFFSFLVFPTTSDERMPLDRYLLAWMRVAQFRIDDQIDTLLSEIKAVVPASLNPKFGGQEPKRRITFFSPSANDLQPQPRVRSGRMVQTFKASGDEDDFLTSCKPSSPRVHARRKSTLGVTIALKEMDLSVEDHFHLRLKKITEDSSECSAKTTPCSAQHMSITDIQSYLASVAVSAQSDGAMDILRSERRRNVLQETLDKVKEKYQLTAAAPQEQKPVGEAQEEVAFLRRGTVAKLQILKLKALEEAQRAAAIAKEVRVIKSAEEPSLPKMQLGETLVHKCESCIFVLATSKSFSDARNDPSRKRLGNVYMTSFKLCFIAENVMVEDEDSVPITTNRMEATLGSIKRIDLLDAAETKGYHLSIECKDHRAFYISFPEEKGDIFGKLFYDVINKYTHSVDVNNLFAFSVKKEEYTDNEMFSSDFDGWGVFDPEEEYRRQGLLVDEETGSAHPSRNNSIRTDQLPAFTKSSRSASLDPSASLKESTNMDSAAAPRWRLWRDNYSLVQSYPSAFIVPAQLSDEEITDAAKYRSRHRVPAVTWGAPSGAVLARSSQPMSGITAARSLADKLLLNLLRTKGKLHSEAERTHPSKFYIVDCRSRIAATANAALGKGVENDKKLVRARVVFCGIANIHTMRDSFAALGKLLSPGSMTQSHHLHLPKSLLTSIRSGLAWAGIIRPKREGHHVEEEMERDREVTHRETMTFRQNRPVSRREVWVDPEADQIELQLVNNLEYGAKLEDVGWLDHIRLVMSSSIMVADKLYSENSSVLVHCSDGWDRTAQVCSTSQVILDPYFRSLEGLFVLIEKDWTSFGHKFQDRIGHGINFATTNNDNLKEVSPVFLQWLDVVWQMLQQFPTSFEYNEKLLIFIMDSVYSNISGTFLGNSEYERKAQLRCHEKTKSVWELVMKNEKAFSNPAYVLHDGPLWPTVKRVCLWQRLYCRYLAEFHPKVLTGESWLHDDEEEVAHAMPSYHDEATISDIDAELSGDTLGEPFHPPRHPAEFEETFCDAVATDWVGITRRKW